jgi:hypothetical protein
MTAAEGTHQKKITHLGRLDGKRKPKTSLGRLTSISDEPPLLLQPLGVAYEKVVKIEKFTDPVTGEIKKRRTAQLRYDEQGKPVPKPPKEWAFGAWDIEAHCYEHTCSERHRADRCRAPGCPACEDCPACNPEHGDHWIAAQLSTLRIPDAYIDYVANLDESQMFGGTRQEGGRYVEFLNGGRSLIVMSERARCLAPDGCIDRTMRFLMAHPCFFQKTKVSKGYIAKGQHTEECSSRKNAKEDGTPCAGCLRRPHAPGRHTSKCRWDRGFHKKDGSPCDGCATLSTIWYAHFGGGYDFNFALRWLSNHGRDVAAINDAVVEVYDDAEREQLKRDLGKRFNYKAESLLSGATHIQVKLSKLAEVWKNPKPTKKSIQKMLAASLASAPPEHQPRKKEGPGSKDYWLKGFLERGLGPSGELCSVAEAQETLRIIMGSKIKKAALGTIDERTREALRSFQKKCRIEPTGEIDRETSAALRYLRSKTVYEADPKEVILLRDSFRLVPSSLDAAAKDFDLKHPVTGEPLHKISDIDVTNPPPPDDPDYRAYCRRDTEICVQLVTTLATLIAQLGGTLEMTASACSMALFRRQFLKDRIPRHRHLTGCRMLCRACGTETCSQSCGTSRGKAPGENLEKHRKLLKRHEGRLHRLCKTYPVGCFHFAAIGKNGFRHGGHVDVLRQKLDKGYCYDVNSLYPYAMLGPVPVGPMQRYVNLTPRETRDAKPGSALTLAASAWRLQQEKVLDLARKKPEWRRLVETHGIEMATLEATFRVGADRGPDPKTGQPFDDFQFDRFDSFRRIKRCGFVEAIVSIPQDDRTPESYFPPLPVVRDSDGGEILFWPVGDGIYGWWAYEELRAMLEIPGAHLVTLRQSVWFRGEPVFREFVEKLYDMRQNATSSAMKQLLKLNMNGLYGKTLQNPLKRRVMRLQITQERPAGWLPTNPNPPDGDDFSWPWGTLQEYRESPFFVPQWGALITARARMVLWRMCMRVERGLYGKGKHVSYCDTDSLYCDAIIKDIVDQKQLGMLKLEYGLTEEERQKQLKKYEDSWTQYQKEHEARVLGAKQDPNLDLAAKRERLSRLEHRHKFFKKKRYDDERESPKYERARPNGIITCEFHGPKLYLVLDPATGNEVKTVHKGSPEPNAEKLRKFIRGEALKGKAKAPKAGVGIRDDFVFDPIILTRTGKKALWKKPKKGEREIMHKRVHHHSPDDNGTTSPRFISTHEEFELEESFRSRRMVTAAKLYEEWTGETWPETDIETQAVG